LYFFGFVFGDVLPPMKRAKSKETKAQANLLYFLVCFLGRNSPCLRKEGRKETRCEPIYFDSVTQRTRKGNARWQRNARNATQRTRKVANARLANAGNARLVNETHEGNSRTVATQRWQRTVET